MLGQCPFIVQQTQSWITINIATNKFGQGLCYAMSQNDLIFAQEHTMWKKCLHVVDNAVMYHKC